MTLGPARSRVTLPDVSVDADPPSFEQLIDLLVAGNDPAAGSSGVLTEFEGGEAIRRRRVWRLRHMVRIEEPPGHTRALAGESTFWRAPDDFLEEIWELCEPDESLPADLESVRLVDPRKYWLGWLSKNRQLVTSSLRPVRFEERSAWQFTAPQVKGGSASVTVDAHIGLVLRIARDDVGYAVAWSELRIEPHLGPAFFVPHHRTPLTPLAPEPEEMQALGARRQFVAVLARATADWRSTCAVIAEAADEDQARAALATHLGVEQHLADAVLHGQFRLLNRRHALMLREELDLMDSQHAGDETT